MELEDNQNEYQGRRNSEKVRELEMYLTTIDNVVPAKAREGVKIEHEKKLSALQSQEYKGEDEAKIFETKTSINRLQSLIVVTSQAVSTTSTAIIGLRGSDLVPQLVDLCHGLGNMQKDFE
ncbi:hypothetical protein Fmac_028484 [Flemingia macrophylla]|uniref:DUF632 domain-containing protein n=1 Tax=Flemingia macrophylla TaxID=520843 RepID=A0ABD1L7M2_9FABA